MMYKSPIDLVYDQVFTGLKKQMDEDIYKAVLNVGINVDKGELIKALRYDRGQYDQGRKDAMSAITRCADCQHCALDYADQGFGYPTKPIRVCIIHDHETTLDDYCSWARRKDGDEE